MTQSKDELAWDREMSILWTRNLWLGLLHLFSGVAGTFLGLTVDNMVNFKLGLTTIFLDWDSSAGTATQSLETVYDCPFVVWTAMFSFLSSAAHFMVLLNWDKYTSDLAKGLNRFRWWEYSLSSSLIMILIAMLFGVYDVISLVFIFAINGAMCLFGDVHELQNAGRKPEDVDWTAFWYGSIAGLFPWGVITAYMLGSPGVNAAPWFVWVILASYVVLFCTFPLTMWNQYNQNGQYDNSLYPNLKNGGYIAGEKRYGLLSLVAKTMLVWLVISGSSQPTEYTSTA